MFQNQYIISKTSGFYQDVLEAYGFARFLDIILNRNISDNKINITLKDEGSYYSINLENPLSEKDLESLPFDVGFKYIFQETAKGTGKPKNMTDTNIFDIQNEWKIVKDFKSDEQNESQKKPDKNFNIYTLLSQFSVEVSTINKAETKQTGMFTRTYLQLYYNQVYFIDFIKGLFHIYKNIENDTSEIFEKIAFKEIFLKEDKKKTDKNTPAKSPYFVLGDNHKITKTTYNALLHPNMSKGNNATKLKLSEDNSEPNFLREYMKILGTFECMFSIGGNQKLDDYRVYVCNPKIIDINLQSNVISAFRKVFYTNSTIKGDIYSLLLFSKEIINYLELNNETLFDFDWNPQNYIQGFYVCHFMTTKKSPPKKHSPINLCYLSLPNFMEVKTEEQAQNWKTIIDELLEISRSIKGASKDKTTKQLKDEDGKSVIGLGLLRNFLSNSEIKYFLDFSFWYASYLMNSYERKARGENSLFIKPFKIETLKLFYTNMDKENKLNLTEIITNEGFLAVASAIRNSTIRLQVKSRFQEAHKRFDIKYGFAQELINKSKSKPDFIKFIGDFLAKYDSETAKHKEKNLNIIFRPNIRKDDKDSFFSMVEKYSKSINVIGALLASYGFALEKFEDSNEDKLEKLNKEATKLGYQLVKIEDGESNMDSSSLELEQD